jgi:hypothetical protein
MSTSRRRIRSVAADDDDETKQRPASRLPNVTQGRPYQLLPAMLNGRERFYHLAERHIRDPTGITLDVSAIIAEYAATNRTFDFVDIDPDSSDFPDPRPIHVELTHDLSEASNPVVVVEADIVRNVGNRIIMGFNDRHVWTPLGECTRERWVFNYVYSSEDDGKGVYYNATRLASIFAPEPDFMFLQRCVVFFEANEHESEAEDFDLEDRRAPAAIWLQIATPSGGATDHTSQCHTLNDEDHPQAVLDELGLFDHLPELPQKDDDGIGPIEFMPNLLVGFPGFALAFEWHHRTRAFILHEYRHRPGWAHVFPVPIGPMQARLYGSPLDKMVIVFRAVNQPADLLGAAEGLPIGTVSRPRLSLPPPEPLEELGLRLRPDEVMVEIRRTGPDPGVTFVNSAGFEHPNQWSAPAMRNPAGEELPPLPAIPIGSTPITSLRTREYGGVHWQNDDVLRAWIAWFYVLSNPERFD